MQEPVKKDGQLNIAKFSHLNFEKSQCSGMSFWFRIFYENGNFETQNIPKCAETSEDYSPENHREKYQNARACQKKWPNEF